MHRRAGLRVYAGTRVGPDVRAVLEVRLGPVWVAAPVQVVAVIDRPERVGFAYGTLRGHPEQGEERFEVALARDETVTAHIRAFSRPGRWFTRLGGPAGRVLQRSITERYLNALTEMP